MGKGQGQAGREGGMVAYRCGRHGAWQAGAGICVCAAGI